MKEFALYAGCTTPVRLPAYEASVTKVLEKLGVKLIPMKDINCCGAQYIDDVANAEDALEKLIEQHYDVILCDYNLGEGRNGQQLLEEVMHRHIIPYGTIYIMITAENTQAMVMAAVEYRPDGYLNKPFPKDLLIKRLETLLEGLDPGQGIRRLLPL